MHSQHFCYFRYVFILFLGGYNSLTTGDIKLKFPACLSNVEVNKCVKFQIPMYTCFTVGIFRISPTCIEAGDQNEHVKQRRYESRDAPCFSFTFYCLTDDATAKCQDLKVCTGSDVLHYQLIICTATSHYQGGVKGHL